MGSQPNNIDASLNQVAKNKIEVTPVLLNQGDSITVKFILISQAPTNITDPQLSIAFGMFEIDQFVSVDSRIKGIKNVLIETQEDRTNFLSSTIDLLSRILFTVFLGYGLLTGAITSSKILIMMFQDRFSKKTTPN